MLRSQLLNLTPPLPNANRLLDYRTGAAMQVWRPSSYASGGIRSLAVDPDDQWVVIGYSSGRATMLDMRTGVTLYRWRAHDADVVQLKAISPYRFVSTSLDKTVALWSSGLVDNSVKIMHRSYCSEPVHGVTTCSRSGDLMTLSGSRYLSVHSNMEKQDAVVENSPTIKLRNFKGCTSISMLPHRQLLLVGQESGQLTLIS